MTAALGLGVQAFVVGLSGAMSPGSYLTVTVARTMQKGPLSAALMLVGHALLEAALILGFAFGLHRFLQRPTVLTALALAGGLVLLLMAFGLVTGALRGTIVADLRSAEHAGMSSHPLGAMAQGAFVSVSNPYWTLWWATIGVKLAADGIAIGPIGMAAFFLGHELADVAWYGLVISLVHRGRALLTPRVYRYTIGVLGALLGVLGVRFLVEGVAGRM